MLISGSTEDQESETVLEWSLTIACMLCPLLLTGLKICDSPSSNPIVHQIHQSFDSGKAIFEKDIWLTGK